MQAFGLDFGAENGCQAVLPEKMMGQHPKKPVLLPRTMKPAQQKLSSDVVLFFACSDQAH